MAEIIVKFEDKVIERIVTEKKRISIGRTNENDVVLENRAVSRKHAMVLVPHSELDEEEPHDEKVVSGLQVRVVKKTHLQRAQ